MAETPNMRIAGPKKKAVYMRRPKKRVPKKKEPRNELGGGLLPKKPKYPAFKSIKPMPKPKR